MAQPIDFQVGFAQQINIGAQQQLHLQQLITHQEHLGKKAISEAEEGATKVQNLIGKSDQEVKVDEKRTGERFIRKRRVKKREAEKKEVVQKAIEYGKGELIDVTV